MGELLAGILGTIIEFAGIVFVILKIDNSINWPWLWVLAPFWVPIALAIIFYIVIYVILSR